MIRLDQEAVFVIVLWIFVILFFSPLQSLTLACMWMCLWGVLSDVLMAAVGLVSVDWIRQFNSLVN